MGPVTTAAHAQDRWTDLGGSAVREARWRYLAATFASWFAYLVADFLSHAVILEVWWRTTERYWLPPEELFRFIPFGYLSFAIYCASLTWLLVRIHDSDAGILGGLKVGIVVGLVYGTAFAFAVYSILSIPVSALVVFPFSVILGSSGAGAASGSVLVSRRPWRRLGVIVGLGVAMLIIGVVVQNVFIPATPERIIGGGS